jgi:energy-converting hydrogenase Eha subunit F
MPPNEAEHFQFNGICTILFCFFLFLLFSLLLHLTWPAHLDPDYLTPNPSTNPANQGKRLQTEHLPGLSCLSFSEVIYIASFL